MKILHIWDAAGVASVISKWQRKMLGHETKVIKNSKHDHLGITKFYDGTMIKNKWWFVALSIIEARKYDIIHCHDAWFVVIPIKLLYPKKLLVMHYHGSLVRNNIKPVLRKIWEKFTDIILVSTPDLLDFEYDKAPMYIPNPVDTELFHPVEIPKNGKVFSSLKRNSDPDRITEMIRDMGIKGTIDLQKNEIGYTNGIPYHNFPGKLSQYEYYADIIIMADKICKAHSMCGLQAMSMGLKVIDWDSIIHTGLPDRHTPENVTMFVEKAYGMNNFERKWGKA